MMKKATLDLVEMLGCKRELIPVRNVYDSKNIHVWSVVKITESRFPSILRRDSYHHIDLQLKDLLLGKDMVDLGSTNREDFVEGAMEQEVEGGMEVGGGMGKHFVEGKAEFDVNIGTKKLEFKLEKNFLKLADILKNLEESDVNKKLIQKLNLGRREELGLVYETLKTTSQLTLEKNVTKKGILNFSWKDITKVGAKTIGKDKKTIQLPAGCTMAYKVYRLPWVQKGKPVSSLCDSQLDSDGVEDFSAEVACDFIAMKQKVKAELKEFRNLCQASELIWEPLSRILASPQTLDTLDCVLEEGCVNAFRSLALDEETKEFQPLVQKLLELVGLLPDTSANPNVFLKPLSLLVSALTELEEEAVMTIAGLEKDVQVELLNLVEDVLKNVCSGDSVPPLSQNYPHRVWAVAEEVLGLCGLVLDKEIQDSSLGRQGAPDITLLSLYITLHGLAMLLEQ